MAMTYEEAVRRLGRRTSVQIDKRRGTEFRRAQGEAGDHGDIQVSYRGTPVVTFHPDDTYTLRTGGMASKVIIKRIAEYSPISLIRRGNGFFIEDVVTGKLMPFLEGARVDQSGRVLDDEGGLIMDNPTPAPPPVTPRSTEAGDGILQQQIDEVKLRAYIKRTVLEVLSETVMPANINHPLRPATVRIQASSDGGGGEGAVSLEMVERLLVGVGVSSVKAKRLVRDLRLARTRGRGQDRANDAEGLVAEGMELVEAATDTPQQQSTNTGPQCGKCTEPMVMHYDKANRYRGCDYALDHSGEKVELIR